MRESGLLTVSPAAAVDALHGASARSDARARDGMKSLTVCAHWALATFWEDDMSTGAMKRICFLGIVVLTLLTQTGIVGARPNATGTLLWQQQLDFGGARSVTLDHQGNVVAVGGIRTGVSVV